MAAAGFSPCTFACKQPPKAFYTNSAKNAHSENRPGSQLEACKSWSFLSRNGGSQLIIDLNPIESTSTKLRRSSQKTGRVTSRCIRAKAGEDWTHFMQELKAPKDLSQRRSHFIEPEADQSSGKSPEQTSICAAEFPATRLPFAKIDPPSRTDSTVPSSGLDERRRQLIEHGSQAVSNASRRAAESAEEASKTAAKLARYARRKIQHRTGGLYTGTTIEDDIFPLQQPTRNEMFILLGLAIVLASVLGWRWQAKLDGKGTRFTSFAPPRPKDPNKPKLPAPVPPIPELGANPRQKESAEWLNMVLGKVWKVYQRALESWIVQSLQPAFDDLDKPAWVGRVRIQQFYLGEEPITIRSVQRRVSRRANDLQYNMAFRYTGGARMLLMVPIRSGPLKVDMPVGVRRLDLDAELWIKVRLVPTEPYVGSFTWAFANKPRIKLVLAPFRFVNLMNIPLISRFLLKLLTEDLPRNFELPNKVVVDLLKDKVSGPSPNEDPANLVFDSGFQGELNVTLCEAEQLPVWGLGFLSDPHCILTIGQQQVRSKRDSDTSIRGKSGFPVWNQDFFFLIEDKNTQKLVVQVRDSPTTLKLDVAKGAIDLANLPDLEPMDVWIDLVHNRGIGPAKVSRPAGRLLLRLTYKSYVDDDDEGPIPMASRAKKGKTTLVEDLPEFDVAQIPDLVTNDLPVAVAEGVQKGIDALPEEIPAAIQKGIDAIPPEIPEAVTAGSEKAHDDMETVQQSLSDAVPAGVKEQVESFQKGASDFWAEGIGNAIENIGFGANTAHVEKMDEPKDIREVAIRDKSSPGPHDYTVFREEADVSDVGEQAKASEPPPPPIKVADVTSEGSVFSVQKEGRDDKSNSKDIEEKGSGRRRTETPVTPTPTAGTATMTPVSPTRTVVAPAHTAVTTPGPAVNPTRAVVPPPPSPVASEALEKVTGKSSEEIAREAERSSAGRNGLPIDSATGRSGFGVDATGKMVADVTINDPEEDRTNQTGLGDEDAVDIKETVDDVKKQIKGAFENLKGKVTGES